MSEKAIAKRPSRHVAVAQPERRAEVARQKKQNEEEAGRERDQVLANRWLAFCGMMSAERARRETEDANETVRKAREKASRPPEEEPPPENGAAKRKRSGIRHDTPRPTTTKKTKVATERPFRMLD